MPRSFGRGCWQRCHFPSHTLVAFHIAAAGLGDAAALRTGAGGSATCDQAHCPYLIPYSFGVDVHPAYLLAQAGVWLVLAQCLQIRVAREPFEIAIAEVEGHLDGLDGFLEFARERKAAREVVEHERVLRFELRELLVDLQTFLDAAALGVVVAQDLQRLHVSRIA